MLSELNYFGQSCIVTSIYDISIKQHTKVYFGWKTNSISENAFRGKTIIRGNVFELCCATMLELHILTISSIYSSIFKFRENSSMKTNILINYEIELKNILFPSPPAKSK